VSAQVAQERRGSVLHLVLDAPRRRNALSLDLLAELGHALAAVDDDVTGVVIEGRGECFSAGADFGDLTGTAADLVVDDAVAAVTAAVRSLPCVVIAAIEGPCVGAAADVALACDLRVAAQGSWIQVPAVRLGILYNPQAITRLAATYPSDALRRLLLVGERFSADEAHAAGLASYLTDRGNASGRADSLLDDIDQTARDAIAATKGLLTSLTADTTDTPQWQRRRVELLESPARRAAVERARQRHASTPQPPPDDQGEPTS
jgi:enoyl-CoA hydratase/carnithine racemase